MAAIATIADAVPLREKIAPSPLSDFANCAGRSVRDSAPCSPPPLDPADKQITGFDVAFRLAPRINAAGRMDVASESSSSSARAMPRAPPSWLPSSNPSTASVAMPKQPHSPSSKPASPTTPTSPQPPARCRWRRLASRRHRHSRLACRRAHRQAAIVVSVEDGIAHGSGRSVDGFHLLEAIESCGDLFTRFGGHAFAVGFAMPANGLPELPPPNLHADERLGRTRARSTS